MTAAANPSPWYTRLIGYKNGNKDHHTSLSALTAAYLAEHEAKFEGLLGGSIEQIVAVPSTRGRSFEDHPLSAAIRRSVAFKGRLVDGLRHTPGVALARQEYRPETFQAGAVSVSGKRVLLVEDLWVSGAKVISAAGALLGFGAAIVAIAVIAREIQPGFWGEDHPYLAAMAAPYRLESWPR